MENLSHKKLDVILIKLSHKYSRQQIRPVATPFPLAAGFGGLWHLGGGGGSAGCCCGSVHPGLLGGRRGTVLSRILLALLALFPCIGSGFLLLPEKYIRATVNTRTHELGVLNKN